MYASLIGLQDIVSNAEGDQVRGHAIGQRVVLPSSFTGGPRQMNQLYQDAMAIVRDRSNPSFFITFTCNPNWQEITEALPKRSNG